jgi:copper(I)-binding protein
MLVGLKDTLRVGQDVPLVLLLEGGEKVNVMVSVGPIGSQ